MANYKYHKQVFLVTYNNTLKCNRSLKDIVATEQLYGGEHSLEEADYQIVLHSVDIAKKDKSTLLDVYSLDTDVFALLTGFHSHIPASATMLQMKEEKLSIYDSYLHLGKRHAEALIGWYAFKGTDNTGSFAVKDLKSNFKVFLVSDYDILNAFSFFGTDTDIPEYVVSQTERYTCPFYRPNGFTLETLW